jgi:hypothetical protein
LEKITKPLDKWGVLCYNKYVRKRNEVKIKC